VTVSSSFAGAKTLFASLNWSAECRQWFKETSFEISPSGITHTPTGAKYTPHPGAPYSGNLDPGPAR
jgi:hypothetical protein